MKKKEIIIGVSILLVIGTIGILLMTKKETTFKRNGITYALKVVDAEGNITRPTDFPEKENYTVDVDCVNADGKWLYDEWKLNIENPQNNMSCKVTFTAVEKTTLVNKIISLNNTTQGNGKVVNEPSTDYRYEGKNPNNYVWFNNELWRIIGVFGENTHGQSGNLVKIIKADSIDGLPWDAMGENIWATSETTPKSSLNVYLNNYYYHNADPSEITLATPVYKFPSKEKGIKDNYREMIQQVTWKLGGHNTADATAETFYSAERGTTVPSGASATYKGYIGLMYPSDYGYSVLSSSCSRTTYLFNYHLSPDCSNNSWIFGQGREWTLMPRQDIYAYYISSGAELRVSGTKYNTVTFYNNGFLNIETVSRGYAVRPALYLRSSVYVVDGDGSMSDPYIIMN